MVDEPMKHHRHRDKRKKRTGARKRVRPSERERLIDELALRARLGRR